MSRKKWVEKREPSEDDETLEIARGLYSSKVAVNRPPSLAQCDVYNKSNARPVSGKSLRSRPRSAVARLSTEKQSSHIDETTTGKPPWRPFSGQASLSRPNKSCIDNRDNLAFNVTLQLDDEVIKSAQKKPTVMPEVYRNRPLPHGIAGLKNWLTADVPLDWCGIDPESNFVFLPCLSSINIGDLPFVPKPQDTNDQLVFTPDPKPWKYRPPPKSIFWKFLKAERSCSDTQLNNIEDAKNSHSSGLIEQLAKLEITQEKDSQCRTTEIIRREIQDLENLLKGIGNPSASSIISQYQYEITLLRKAARETVNEYVLSCSSEDEQQSMLQEEYSRFTDEHDEIIKAIRERRDKCVRELAALERNLMNS